MSFFNGLVNTLANTLTGTVGAAIGSQTALRVQVHMQPYPMPHQVAKVLDHPLRQRYRDVGDTLGLFGISAGMTVLDLGCGTGLFTIPAARMVGESGRVHAVDIQTQMLDVTRTRAEEAGIGARCSFHHAGAYELALETQSVDVALVVATLGEIPDKLHAMLELYRVIRPGGRVCISEELLDPAYLPSSAVRQYAESAGFLFAGKTGNPFCYQMVFTHP